MGNPRMPVIVDPGSSSFPASKPPSAVPAGKKPAGKRPTTVDPQKRFGGTASVQSSKKIRPQRG